MEHIPSRSARPPLALVTGVLGLLGAAVWAVMAVLLVAGGGLTAGTGSGAPWIVVLVALALGQGWGAVRLLRRRGWVLLARGSLPGLLSSLVLLVLWTEYRQELTPQDVLASLPVLPLLLLPLPSVRRWAAPRRTGSPAEENPLPTSRA